MTCRGNTKGLRWSLHKITHHQGMFRDRSCGTGMVAALHFILTHLESHSSKGLTSMVYDVLSLLRRFLQYYDGLASAPNLWLGMKLLKVFSPSVSILHLALLIIGLLTKDRMSKMPPYRRLCRYCE